jgi:hypothetical protein
MKIQAKLARATNSAASRAASLLFTESPTDSADFPAVLPVGGGISRWGLGDASADSLADCRFWPTFGRYAPVPVWQGTYTPSPILRYAPDPALFGRIQRDIET